MALTRSLSLSVTLLVSFAAVLGGCGGASGTMVVFRDLADIPDRPAVTDRADNDEAIKALMEDRASTAQAAESLRNEPFAAPEPAPTRAPP
jgi:hypothetical protein